VTHRNFLKALAPAVLLVGTACAELEVPNLTQPDVSRVLAAPADVANLANSSINSWYQTATYFEPMLMLSVTADALTANFGNFGMRFNNLEPRIAYNNSSAAADGTAALSAWNGYYGSLGAANDALRALDAGIVITGTPGTEGARASALFTQAASLSSISMLFDKAFVVTEKSTGTPSLQDYKVVRDSAMNRWDALIALTNGKTWSLAASVLPLGSVTPSATFLNRLANTMAARTLVYNARTGAENGQTNWARVLTYANRGLTGPGLTDVDFAPIYDDNLWFDYAKLYGNLDSWTRVDQRLINRMAPNVAAKYAGTAVAPVSNDQRLGNAAPCGANPTACLTGFTRDYAYLGTVIGDPNRGIFMQSPYYHTRYRNLSFAVAGAARIGRPMPFVLAAENDLLRAEALARTNGDLALAASLVNKTRVTRGGLAPVGAVAADIIAAVDYERDVELLNTGFIELMDRRRFESLQPLNMRQLPIPARELETLGLPIYTFRGPGN